MQMKPLIIKLYKLSGLKVFADKIDEFINSKIKESFSFRISIKFKYNIASVNCFRND